MSLCAATGMTEALRPASNSALRFAMLFYVLQIYAKKKIFFVTAHHQQGDCQIIFLKFA